MKLQNETKVAFLIVVILGLAVMGIRFLKGRRDFNNATRIYAVFDRVGSLSTSDQVKINGLSVGEVDKLEEADQDLSGIKVTIRLTRDIHIPTNSVATINNSLGGFGASVLNIEKGNSTTWLRNGDILQTAIDTSYLLTGKQIIQDVVDAIMENKQKQQSKTRDSLP